MYVQIENNKLMAWADVPFEGYNKEFSTMDYNEYTSNPNKYIFDGEDFILNPNYEEEQAQKEKERIAMLSLTRGDVFRGLLMAKGVTRAQLRAMIETNELLSVVEKEMALIDFDEALNFYRGNALINTVGLAIGITSEQLDKFFETNDYTCLLTVEEVENESVEA